jgi:hypothetical protein
MVKSYKSEIAAPKSNKDTDSESESGFFLFQTRSKKLENSVEHFRFQSVFLSFILEKSIYN